MKRLIGALLSCSCSLIFWPDPDGYKEQTDTLCADGVDNDADGDTDCDDTGCLGTTSCDPCGNGALDEFEDCDDANEIAGDGCDPNCHASGCGNGFLAPFELCPELLLQSPVGNSPNSLAVGDLNGDDTPDIATGNTGSDSATVLFMQVTGAGAVANPTTLIFSTIIPDVVIGNFDTDPKNELILAQKFDNKIGFAKHISGSTFDVNSQDISPATHPFGLVAKDADGDGSLDLFSANFESNDVSVLFVQDALIDIAQTITTPVPNVDGPIRIDAADINGDGLLDFATANQNIPTMTIGVSQPDGTFAMTTFGVSGAADVLFIDIDQDLRDDLVVSNANAAGLSFFRNVNGTLAFSQDLPAPTSSAQELTRADLDNNSFDDVILASAANIPGVFYVYFNNGGSLQSAQPFNVDPPSKKIEAADFNRDGFLDLVFMDQGSSAVSIYLNRP